MKNGKVPTRKQKIAIKNSNLNPNNWLVYKTDSEFIHIVHRQTNTTKKVYK